MMTTLGIPLFIYSISIFSIETKRFCSSTNSAGSSIPVNIGVFRRVLVSLWTVSLKRLILSSFTASRVLSVKHWLQMSWVAAKRASAQMVDLVSSWNCTNKHFIDDSVDGFWFSAYTYVTISVFSIPSMACCSKPNPTTRGGFKENILLNAFWKIINLHQSNLTLEVVV
jgi:hypothetical protein